MGFKRANIAEKLKLVSVLDPAVDTEASDIDAYERSADIKYLKFKPNQQPTYFVCRQLTKRELAQLNDEATTYVIRKDGEAVGHLKLQERNLEAFRMAVVAVENYDGPPLVRTNGKVSEDWLETFPSFEVLQEIGMKIVELSQLSGAERKNL